LASELPGFLGLSELKHDGMIEEISVAPAPSVMPKLQPELLRDLLGGSVTGSVSADSKMNAIAAHPFGGIDN